MHSAVALLIFLLPSKRRIIQHGSRERQMLFANRLRHLTNYDFDHVLILSGDQLYQMDFGNMFRTHEKNGSDITIATIPVTEKEATEFGILKSDEPKSLVHLLKNRVMINCRIGQAIPGRKCKLRKKLSCFNGYLSF